MIRHARNPSTEARSTSGLSLFRAVPMRITIESDPGYAGRAAAQRAADAVRAAIPNADVVVNGPVLPRLPVTYSAMAPSDYGIRQMLRTDA
jgi:hypothetical protein